MQTAFSDRSRPALQSGPGPGGPSGSCPGNSREAALGSSPGRMRNSGGDYWGSSEFTWSAPLWPTRTLRQRGWEANLHQPHHRPGTSSHWDSHHPHRSLWVGSHPPQQLMHREEGCLSGHTMTQGQQQDQNLGPLHLSLRGECFLTMTVGLLASFQGYPSPSPSEHNFCSFKISISLLS